MKRSGKAYRDGMHWARHRFRMGEILHLALAVIVAATLSGQCVSAWSATPAPISGQEAPHGADADPPAWPEVRVQVVSRMNTTISAPMSGQLDVFPLRDGDHFKKDEVLAHFVCAEQLGALAHARAVLEEKRRVLATNSRLNQLGTGSALEYHVALAQVAEASADVQTATAMVDACTVKAPFAGRVGGVVAHDYQYLSVGAPLLEILEDRALQLELIVPSRWLIWLKPGTNFRVSIDETGHTYQAELIRLSGRVDAVSQSIKAYGKFISPPPDLLPGMSGHADFHPPRP